MKKFIAFLCAVMVIATCSISAFAVDTGSITIDGCVDGTVYNAWQIATLESYDTTAGIYSYKVSAGWENFISGAGSAYLKINADGYLEENGTLTAEQKVALADAAIKYAKDNSIDAVGTATAANGTATISGLDHGYFVVDTTLGTFHNLTTTKPTATITEKNVKPSLEKEVLEDSTDSYGSANDASLLDIVYFRATISVTKGAENYVMHDIMEDGLTYLAVTSVTVDGADVSDSNYTVITETDDDCTFEVSFDNEYVASIVGKEIVVEYTAQLNENAIAGEVEKNTAYLTYGDTTNTTNKTTESVTETKMFSFDIVKTDGEKNILDGAEFEIIYDEDSQNAYEFVDLGNGNYRFPVNNQETTTTTIVPVNGQVTIIGFDGDDVVWLKETKAPNGYNLLTSLVKVEMEGENNNATVTNGKYVEGGVQVVNQAGVLLPETGGIGTTMFIVIGGLMVLFAGVLLVAKTRMAKTNA
ncbi:MAG: isopeptide-forming domain-containing fimbrial protein [Ruminococcaceae bacterium]|nr:isopeptide-forming domain-containing fimbrial protein [Oscillospiraceae bacterium]